MYQLHLIVFFIKSNNLFFTKSVQNNTNFMHNFSRLFISNILTKSLTTNCKSRYQSTQNKLNIKWQIHLS